MVGQLVGIGDAQFGRQEARPHLGNQFAHGVAGVRVRPVPVQAGLTPVAKLMQDRFIIFRRENCSRRGTWMKSSLGR